MNDDSKTTPDPIRPHELATQPAAPARTDRASSPLPEKAEARHPSRLEFGDERDDATNPFDHAHPFDARAFGRVQSACGDSDADAGEGREGPRGEESNAPNDHAKPTVQPNVSERQHSAPPRPPPTAELRQETPKHQHEDDGRAHLGPDPRVTQPNADVTARDVAGHDSGGKSKGSTSGDNAKK